PCSLTGQILDALVLDIRPRCVLELGTYCGYSAVRIARLLPPGARLVTIEMNPHYAQVAREIFEYAGLEAQGEQPVGGAMQPSPHRRWRLQEALLFTTLHCLQLPLQLFSRTPQNPLPPSFPHTPEETAERQQTDGGLSCKVRPPYTPHSSLLVQGGGAAYSKDPPSRCGTVRPRPRVVTGRPRPRVVSVCVCVYLPPAGCVYMYVSAPCRVYVYMYVSAPCRVYVYMYVSAPCRMCVYVCICPLQ
ncbi:hypothetical protein FKM82_029824, partial [Ascaphus truei]